MAGGGRALAIIVAASFLLKAALVWMVTSMPCTHDQCHYLDLADGILAGRGLQVHDGYLWPPGFFYLLAACRWLFGASLTPPRLLQVLASTLTVPFVYLLARRLHDHRAGLAAAAVFAFYPNLVAFTHLFWPATFYIFCFVIGFTTLLRPRPASPRDAALAGVWFGMAALFKGMALYFTPLAAAWLLWRGGGAKLPAPSFRRADPRTRRARLLAAAILLAGALAPILPWTMRNAVVYHRFLLLDATAGRNLYIGNNVLPPSNWDLGLNERRRIHYGRPRCSDANVVDANRCEIHNALEFMARHPGMTLSRVPLKIADLLNPTSFLIRHVRLQKYPHVFSLWQAQMVTVLAALPWMVVAALGLAGLILLPAGPGCRLVALLLLYQLALHAATFGLSRFRLPMVPWLIAMAAPFLTRGWRALPERPPAWRIMAVALGIGVLLHLWASRWGTILDIFRPAA